MFGYKVVPTAPTTSGSSFTDSLKSFGKSLGIAAPEILKDSAGVAQAYFGLETARAQKSAALANERASALFPPTKSDVPWVPISLGVGVLALLGVFAATRRN